MLLKLPPSQGRGVAVSRFLQLFLCCLFMMSGQGVAGTPGYQVDLHPYFNVVEPMESLFKEDVTLRECIYELDDGPVQRMKGLGDTFMFTANRDWRYFAESTGYFSPHSPPACAEWMSDRRCIQEVLHRPEKTNFCFESGVYDQGCRIDPSDPTSHRNNDECGYEEVPDPNAMKGWTAPIVITRDRAAHEDPLQIRTLALDETMHPSDHGSPVLMHMPLAFLDVSNDPGLVGRTWIVHGLSFRDQLAVDRNPRPYTGACRTTPWQDHEEDHEEGPTHTNSWFNLRAYDTLGSDMAPTSVWAEQNGTSYRGAASSTILLQCSSDVWLSHLELLDNDHRQNVLIRGDSHHNRVQDSLLGYTDDFIHANRGSLVDWLDHPTLNANAYQEEDQTGSGASALKEQYGALRLSYPEHQFFQDSVCVHLATIQEYVHPESIAHWKTEGTRVIENEFMNCNDGVHIGPGVRYDGWNANPPIIWDPTVWSAWHSFPNTVVENNDFHLTKAAYTNCQGAPAYDAFGVLTANSDVDHLCAFAENATDMKSGGWYPVAVDGTYDPTQVETAANRQIRVLGNRAWGYRQSDPFLRIKVPVPGEALVYIPNSNRGDPGIAFLAHMNAQGIIYSDNVAVDTVGGILMSNDSTGLATHPWHDLGVPEDELHHMLAVNNLVADAAWYADPVSLTGPTNLYTPINNDDMWKAGHPAISILNPVSHSWHHNAAFRQDGPSTIACNTVSGAYAWLASDALDLTGGRPFTNMSTITGNLVVDGGIVVPAPGKSPLVSNPLTFNEFHSLDLAAQWMGPPMTNSPTQLLVPGDLSEVWGMGPYSSPISVPTASSGPLITYVHYPAARWTGTPSFSVRLPTSYGLDVPGLCDPADWRVTESANIFAPWVVE